MALLLLVMAVMPLFYLSTWLGFAAVIALYALMARLANQNFDRQSRKHTNPPRHPRKP